MLGFHTHEREDQDQRILFRQLHLKLPVNIRHHTNRSSFQQDRYPRQRLSGIINDLTFHNEFLNPVFLFIIRSYHNQVIHDLKTVLSPRKARFQNILYRCIRERASDIRDTFDFLIVIQELERCLLF